MKTTRLLITVLGVLTSFPANAIPRPFSGTIDTPATPTLVDSSGAVVTAYVVLPTGGMLYLDSVGLVWKIVDLITPSVMASGGTAGQYYATPDCSGPIYLELPSWDLPGTTYITSNGNGLIYSAGTMSATEIHSQRRFGICAAESSVISDPYHVFLAIGPLTAPTLPSGPYHLELR